VQLRIPLGNVMRHLDCDHPGHASYLMTAR
jgi:hypothetical protein